MEKRRWFSVAVGRGLRRSGRGTFGYKFLQPILAGFAFFLGFWLLPFTAVPWTITMLYGSLLIFLMVRFVKPFNWREKISDMHVFALCTGALTFFLVFAPLQELDKSRKDVTAGMSLEALAFAIGLVWLGTKNKTPKQDSPNK